MTEEISLSINLTIEPGMTVVLGMIDEDGEAFLFADGKVTETTRGGAKKHYKDDALKTLRLNQCLCIGFSGMDEEWRKALWHLCKTPAPSRKMLGTDLISCYEQDGTEWPELSYALAKNGIDLFLGPLRDAVEAGQQAPDVNIVLCGRDGGRAKLCSFGWKSRWEPVERVPTEDTFNVAARAFAPEAPELFRENALRHLVNQKLSPVDRGIALIRDYARGFPDDVNTMITLRRSSTGFALEVVGLNGEPSRSPCRSQSGTAP